MPDFSINNHKRVVRIHFSLARQQEKFIGNNTNLGHKFIIFQEAKKRIFIRPWCYATNLICTIWNSKSIDDRF